MLPLSIYLSIRITHLSTRRFGWRSPSQRPSRFICKILQTEAIFLNGSLSGLKRSLTNPPRPTYAAEHAPTVTIAGNSGMTLLERERFWFVVAD
jgi:hypothetical protein